MNSSRYNLTTNHRLLFLLQNHLIVFGFIDAPGTDALAATVATKKGVRLGKRFTIWRLEAGEEKQK
jgi:hypothetical protein